MADVGELLRYNSQVRRRYFDAFSKMSWVDFAKDRSVSFNSMRNVFIHTLNVVAYWLSFLLREDFESRREFEEYRTYEDIQRYMGHVEKQFDIYLDSLSPEKLKETFMATDDYGKPVEVTAEDVLIHVFEEEVHHRGELIAMLWQMGAEPPIMSWKNL